VENQTQIRPPSPPKRVAVVYRLDRPGGVQSCAIALIRGLNQAGIVPEVLWDVEPDWALLERFHARASYRRIPFPVSTTAITRLPVSLRYLGWIPNAIRGERYRGDYDFFYVFFNGFLLPDDVPHLRYLSGPPLIPALEVTRPGLAGLPVRFFRWLYWAVLRHAWPVYEFHSRQRYVINSSYTGDLFYAAHGIRLPVIHPPIELSGRSFDATDLDQRDTLTFFSRFIPYKRPELVLELARRHPHLRCVLMGAVTDSRRLYFASLQRTARELGLSGVEFLDTPSEEQVRAELARTRFFVFPAQNEHFGMTTAEAIASGALPFVHNSGGQVEIVPDERLRFEDSELLPKFDALLRLDDGELKALRQKMAAHVRGFSEETFIQKMLAYAGLDEALPDRPA